MLYAREAVPLFRAMLDPRGHFAQANLGREPVGCGIIMKILSKRRYNANHGYKGMKHMHTSFFFV